MSAPGHVACLNSSSVTRAGASHWIDAVTATLRSATLRAALHSLSHAIYLLTDAASLEVRFNLPRFKAFAICHYRIEPVSDAFISQIELTPQQEDAPIISTGIDRYIAVECAPDSAAERQLEVTWVSSGLRSSKDALTQLATARPLLVLAAEHLLALASRPSHTPNAEAGHATQYLEDLYCRIGANVLSRRERQVLTALLAGQVPKVIARDFTISPGTVRNHLRHIYSKLHVSSRSELLSRIIHAVISDNGVPSLGDGVASGRSQSVASHPHRPCVGLPQ